MKEQPKRLVWRYSQGKHASRNQDIELKDPQQIPMDIWHAFRTRGETEGLEAPVFRALAERGVLPDLLQTASGWPVYSRQLADIFGEHAVCAPVVITFGRQREASAYCLCTPRITFDGLDKDLTEWKPNPFQAGKVSVKKAVLKQNVDWPPFFRVEGMGAKVFVNKEVATKIEGLEFRGLGFEDNPNVRI